MATRKSESTSEVNTDEAIDIIDEFSAQIKQEEFNTTSEAEQVMDLPFLTVTGYSIQEKDFDQVSPELEGCIKILKNEVLVLKKKLSKSERKAKHFQDIVDLAEKQLIEKEKAVQENKELREQIKTNKKEFKDELKSLQVNKVNLT